MAANVLVWLMSITRGFTPSFPKKFHCGHKQKKTPLDGNKLHLSWKRTIQIYCCTYIFLHTTARFITVMRRQCARSLIRMCSYGKRETKTKRKAKKQSACILCMWNVYLSIFYVFILVLLIVRDGNAWGIHTMVWNCTRNSEPHNKALVPTHHRNENVRSLKFYVTSTITVCRLWNKIFHYIFCWKGTKPYSIYACRFSHNSKN